MAGSRVRKPSRLAREIAGVEPEAGTEGSAPNRKKTKGKAKKKADDDDAAPTMPQPTATANVKAGGKRGRAVLNEKGEVDIEDSGQPVGGGEEDEDEDQLWCICLGRDDNRPMIQCEGCENWFHFECIQLDPAEAQYIEAFYCDLCEESGSGPTRRIDPAAIAALKVKAKAKPKPKVEYKTDSEEEKEDEGPEDAYDNDDSAADPDASSGASGTDSSSEDSEEGEGLARSRARRLNTASGAAVYRKPAAHSATPVQQGSRRKKRKAEGMSSDESDSDEEYRGDSLKKKRKASTAADTKPPPPRRQSNAAGPASSSASKPSAATAATVEKTRKACVDQFVRLFQSAFAGAGSDPIPFATSLETELFRTYAEPDANGTAVPRAQYLGKFRSLLFNIKNNPEFLAGLPKSGIEAMTLAHMSNEDLQTPEQRAMAEKVKQQSLKDSVKTVVEAPRAKRTHKGEEAIDMFDSVDVERAVKETAKREAEFRKAEEDKDQRSPTVPRPTLEPLRKASGGRDLGTAEGLTDEPTEMDSASAVPPPSARPSVNFSFDNVWGSMKPTQSPVLGTGGFQVDGKKLPKDEDDMDTGGDSSATEGEYEPQLEAEEQPAAATGTEEGRDALPDDYDPFASMDGAGEGDDALDKLIRGDEQAALADEGPPKPPTDTLPRVWSGNILTSEEGGFAGQAVQVGGRPLGASPAVWDQLFLSDTLNVVGRLPVGKSVEYLVQSHFARNRELVVVELLPNLSDVPPLPPPDKVKQHRQRFIDTFASKQRHAVVAVKDPKKIVRDIYLVPLTRDAPLPEFLELLDEHGLPETGKRQSDTMLAAIVVQKDVFPTVLPPAPQPAPTPMSLPAPVQGLPPGMALPPGVPMPPPGMPAGSMPMMMPPPPSSGAPPGFMPFPAAPVPSSSSPPNRPHQIDYASLDIPAIKSLMSNAATFRSLLETAPHVAPALARNPNLLAALQTDPSMQPQLAMYPALLNALLGSRPMPPPPQQSPRMGGPPPGGQQGWGRQPPGQGGWNPSPPGPDGHRRSGSGGGRWDGPPPQGGSPGGRGRDFVAPDRDSGWGARRPGPDNDQYSAAVFGGHRGR